MKNLSTAMFWLLAACLIIAHVIVAWHSLVVMRFWEDEAFNLTVPLNLVAGLGYTSDGALSGSTLTPFDPRISTGVSVLLPAAAVVATGIDPVIGARLIPLAYWVLLLAGLAVLGSRIAGRWGALTAVAVPLAFNSALTISPIQGPADLLGEIPAAALIVWALVVLPRRAWLAGLLLGFAVQAKLIALLALPAFAVALWILAPGSGMERLRATVRRSWLPLALVAIPTFLVEVAALLSLGLDGFIDHLRSLAGFLRSGGQHYAPTTVTQKVGTLLDAWFLPWWVTLVVVLAASSLIIGAVLISRRKPDDAMPSDAGVPAPAGAHTVPTTVQYLGLAAITGLAAYVGWWTTASHLPLWVRHPAPGVYAFLPILAAVAVWSLQMLWRSPARPIRVATAAASALLAIALGAGGALHAAAMFSPGWETLETQRTAVAPIRAWAAENDIRWLAAQPWGGATSAVVLSGTHLGLFDAPEMAGVPRLTLEACTTEVLVDGPVYRVCAAP
ncbi:hypothetical protein [Microbacterium aurantiacum]|uniref:hypothetical protein n=1 Tax=Microbacterium aurantiacum TaxID=162393 RepID=UPI000C80A146|nr:hypothetical protein [Microbacterium aurantiacum]